MDTGPVRKSARHARQRFREESSSESSESEHSSSNSSSSDDELPARPPDPTDPLFVQPRYELPVGKRGRLARPMHKGDDEGRDPAKRVRRPPPEDDEEGESTAARATDYLEDDDEDDEDSSDSGSRRAPAMAARRRSQRVVRQAPAAVGQQQEGSHTAADQPDSAGPARVRLSKCWLCTFANCKMAKRIAEFVSANAGSMDPAIMADQIKGEVKKEYPHASGIGRHSVLRHLREHVLLPNVRMASILRSLIALAETLRCTLHQIDEDTGEVMVDIRNTELYLKVIAQLHAVYRTDSSRMMFGGSAGSTAAPAAAGGLPPSAPAGPQRV